MSRTDNEPIAYRRTEGEAGMTFYKKKPIVIEAMQLTDESMWHVWDWIGSQVDEWDWDGKDKYIVIDTPEGKMTAREGDWVIKGVKGEFYPCKPDIFEETYEIAEPSE